MTTATWRLLGGIFITLIVAMEPATGQPVDQKPTAGKPITFGCGVRARDRFWSLLVSPRANTADATLPGAAVVTLYAGRVQLITGEKRTRLQPGATAAVPKGASLRFVNDDKRPAQLRAVVLSGNR